MGARAWRPADPRKPGPRPHGARGREGRLLPPSVRLARRGRPAVHGNSSLGASGPRALAIGRWEKRRVPRSFAMRISHLASFISHFSCALFPCVACRRTSPLVARHGIRRQQGAAGRVGRWDGGGPPLEVTKAGLTSQRISRTKQKGRYRPKDIAGLKIARYCHKLVYVAKNSVLLLLSFSFARSPPPGTGVRIFLGAFSAVAARRARAPRRRPSSAPLRRWASAPPPRVRLRS